MVAAAVVATLQILVTNDAHVTPRMLSEAQEMTQRLYRDLGVEIVWVGQLDADLPLVVSFPPEGGAERLQLGPNAMGYTFRTEDPEPGGRALVFLDRVERRAQLARVSTSRLLGAVMAHEIAHMLLSDAHTMTGLMRPIWTDRDLQLIDMGGLRFNAPGRLLDVLKRTRMPDVLSQVAAPGGAF